MIRNTIIVTGIFLGCFLNGMQQPTSSSAPVGARIGLGRSAAPGAYQGLCVRVDERSRIGLRSLWLAVDESSVTLAFTGAPFPDYQKMCEIVRNDKYRLSAILHHANQDIQSHMQFFVNRCIIAENNIEVLQLCAAHENFKFTQESLIKALWFEKYQAAAIIVRAGMHIDSEVKKNLGYLYSLTDEQIAYKLSKVQEFLSGSDANTSAESVQSLQPEGN